MLVQITNLEESLQESLMGWIFENEDRVWRYRGGRDGRETYAQFVGFLPHKQSDRYDNYFIIFFHWITSQFLFTVRCL